MDAQSYIEALEKYSQKSVTELTATYKRNYDAKTTLQKSEQEILVSITIRKQEDALEELQKKLELLEEELEKNRLIIAGCSRCARKTTYYDSNSHRWLTETFSSLDD